MEADANASMAQLLDATQGVVTLEGDGITQVVLGQCNVVCVPRTAKGRLLFDMALYPPVELGTLREAVRLETGEGKMTKLTGGARRQDFR